METSIQNRPAQRGHGELRFLLITDGTIASGGGKNAEFLSETVISHTVRCDKKVHGIVPNTRLEGPTQTEKANPQSIL